MPETNRNIVWLASYPKSGNTWFRVFLSNFLSGSAHPVHINKLNETPISSNRRLLDNYLGIHSSDLTFDEIDDLRSEIFKRISADQEGPRYFKTHDAWTLNKKGKPLFPEENTKGVIYIIRNPLDVAISYAFHNNETIDQTISILNNNDAALGAKRSRLNFQTRQLITSWSAHVISWVDTSKLPVHVISYEDMLIQPRKSFKSALDFMGLTYNESEIAHAIKNSSFNTLKKMEDTEGFNERSIHSESFFRHGKTNEWKSVLSQAQIDAIIKHHATIMSRFGYLDYITR